MKSLIVKRPSTTHTNIPILSAKIQYKRTNDAAKLTRIILRCIIVEKVLIFRNKSVNNIFEGTTTGLPFSDIDIIFTAKSN